MKEQEKSLPKELNEIEASDLPDTEFKTLVKRVLKEFGERIDELSENLNKERVNIRKDIETTQKNC